MTRARKAATPATQPNNDCEHLLLLTPPSASPVSQASSGDRANWDCRGLGQGEILNPQVFREIRDSPILIDERDRLTSENSDAERSTHPESSPDTSREEYLAHSMDKDKDTSYAMKVSSSTSSLEKAPHMETSSKEVHSQRKGEREDNTNKEQEVGDGHDPPPNILHTLARINDKLQKLDVLE